MGKTAIRLPGKGWRVLSFVPVFNSFSLLYLSAINGNSFHALCAVIYFVLSLAKSSLAPWCWIACIIHYAIAYSSAEAQSKKSSGTVSKRRTMSQHRGALSDIDISGRVERKQAIPPRSAASGVRIQTSFSVERPQDRFFLDMKKYAGLAGSPAAFVPFSAYWPTYDSMDRNQHAWYFYWRTQARAGKYPDTDLSYIFVYVYELLSGVGWQTPQEGYALLQDLWLAYQEQFPKLDHYLPAWIFDFAHLHGLPYTAPMSISNAHQLSSTLVDVAVAQHAEDVPLKLPFVLIDALCDYSLVGSKFFKEGNHELVQEAIPRAVALCDAVLRKKTQKGLLGTYGPNRPKKHEHYVFRSAVCPQANQKMEIMVKAYSTNQRLRGYVNELVRYAENTLREITGCRGRLRGVALDAEMAKLVEAFLKKEYGHPSPETKRQEQKKEVALDFGNINALRTQSDAVRSALRVEEAVTAAPKALLTDVQEVTAVYVALSQEARELLDRLESSGWECEPIAEEEACIAEINRLAEHYLSCALLVREKGSVLVEDDYRDELEHLYQNPPALTEAADETNQFDFSVLSPALKEFVQSLVPEQKKTLHVLLTSEQPHHELEELAAEAATMPQILMDSLNEVAMQTVGDLILDTMESEPRIMDEYAQMLKQSIA